MSNPEVSYSRPQHPDKIPRPPPKSFADFQSATDAAKNPDSVKQSFIPKAGPTEPSSTPQTFGDLALSQADVRMSLLEQRIEQLEGELEELTEAATKPSSQPPSDSAMFVARMVRLAVVDSMVSPHAALVAIAQALGIIETARAAAPSARFLEEARPAPPIKPRGAPVRERPAPEAYHAEEEEKEEPAEEPARGGPEAPPGKRYAGRPSAAMKKAQDAPRKAINSLIAAHGISQARIERASGVPQGALSRWLRGGVTFDPNFIPKVEKAIKKLI